MKKLIALLVNIFNIKYQPIQDDIDWSKELGTEASVVAEGFDTLRLG